MVARCRKRRFRPSREITTNSPSSSNRLGHNPLKVEIWVRVPVRVQQYTAGWTGEAPAWSHKPNYAGSNPAPATKNFVFFNKHLTIKLKIGCIFVLLKNKSNRSLTYCGNIQIREFRFASSY